MKRRSFLKWTGAGMAGGLLRGVLPTAAASKSKPNVLLLISDDQAWTEYGFMGHPIVQTPHLDRFASQSLVLTRAYVPTSLCRPSLATLSSGRYPHESRIVGNDPKGGNNNVAGRMQMIDGFRKLPQLARTLGEVGYVSFQTGKWWEGDPVRNGGFTEGMTKAEGKTHGRHGDKGLVIGRQGMKPIYDFIEKHPGKPFFLWHAPFMPHTPHTPPKRILDKYTPKCTSKFVALYYAMCDWFDETCGELLGYLDKKGLADNTVVVYVCDNGWIQKTQTRGADFARSKRSPYDGGVRTPIMVRWPGKVAPRRDEKTLASSIDIAPTILTACGLKPTAAMPGVNLLDADALGKREAIFGEIFEHDIVEYENPASGLRHRWCIEGTWKLIVPNPARIKGQKPELYDLAADPHEKTDLAAKHPDRVKDLMRKINAWWPAKAGG